jgi:hypothetical protein
VAGVISCPHVRRQIYSRSSIAIRGPPAAAVSSSSTPRVGGEFLDARLCLSEEVALLRFSLSRPPRENSILVRELRDPGALLLDRLNQPSVFTLQLLVKHLRLLRTTERLPQLHVRHRELGLVRTRFIRGVREVQLDLGQRALRLVGARLRRSRLLGKAARVSKNGVLGLFRSCRISRQGTE